MNRDKVRERVRFAEHLRRNRTKSERKFARMLTERGIYFKEQEPLGGFIPDFYFPEHGRRIVELDGLFGHARTRDRDRLRDEKLRAFGYKILRVPSADVFIQPEWLMHRVLMFLGEPHERVSRKARKRRISFAKQVKRVLKPKSKIARVPRLTKDHLPVKWQPFPKPLNDPIEVTPQANKTIKVIKKGNGGTLCKN